VDPGTLSSNLSANSHALPIKMVIEYIVNFVPCRVTIVGIQPETIAFRQRVSVRVREASRRVSRMIAEVLSRINEPNEDE